MPPKAEAALPKAKLNALEANQKQWGIGGAASPQAAQAASSGSTGGAPKGRGDYSQYRLLNDHGVPAADGPRGMGRAGVCVCKGQGAPLGLVGSQLERPHARCAPRPGRCCIPPPSLRCRQRQSPSVLRAQARKPLRFNSPRIPRVLRRPLPWSPRGDRSQAKLCTKRAWRAAGREENGGFWWICSGLYGLARQSG